AGCGMACPFCATGQAGLTRNLSTAEIVAQVVAGARLLAAGQVPGVASRGGQEGSSPRANTARVSNVVFMGMGEPLANYASVLAGRLAHVNLIPLNPTPGSKWTASRPAAQREFVRRLEAHGVPVTVRDTRGREIDGACGQLAASASALTPTLSSAPTPALSSA